LPNPPTDGTTAGSPFVTASDFAADGNWIAYRARPGGTGRVEAMISAGDGSQSAPLGRGVYNANSASTQISDDGATVFGWEIDLTTGLFHAFRWRTGVGLQEIADPSGYNQTLPSGRGVSADGSVSVGDIANVDTNTGNENAHQAYRWTAANGLTPLGFLPGGDRSVALGVSADGTQVFGVSNSTGSPGPTYSGEWYLWSAGGGMLGLGHPNHYNNVTNLGGMSADGSVLTTAAGGDGTPGILDTSFVYALGSHQFFDVGDLLGNMLNGWSSVKAFGISDDGNTLFGAATDSNGRTEGWVAHFPDGYLRYLKPTAVATASRVTTAPNAGHFIITGTTRPYATVTIHATNNLAAGFTLTPGTATADETGLFQFDDAGAVGQPTRFYEVSLP
jgi:WD40 repeat protein